MATSPLLGIDPVPQMAEGRDTEALGPSDTSDSGSDVANIGEPAPDPGLPVDVALQDDRAHPETTRDALDGTSDHTGTGERRSAAHDAGIEGADIGTDRIIDLEAEQADDEI